MSAHQGAQDIAIATPPSLVAGAMWLGWTPDQWVVALTITYLVLSIASKVWQMVGELRSKRRKR